MRLRKGFWLLCGLLFLTAYIRPIQAQDNPDFEIGVKPYGTYMEGNIDNVNIGNGSLDVDIPLISYPQRGGKLKLDFSVHYFNGSVSIAQVCYDVPVEGLVCSYQSSGTQSGLAVIDDQALTYGIPGSSGNPPCTNFQQNDASGISYCVFDVMDSDGAVHDMYPTNDTGTTFRAVDATGLLAFSSGSTGADGPTTFIDSSGITHTNLSWANVSDTRTDSDGNTITYSATTGWTDSLGRTIPLMTESTNASDFTGCTGAQPIAYVYLWNLPGPNGGSYPLKFCYSTITFFDTFLSENQSLPEMTSVLLPNGASWTFEWSSNSYSYVGMPDLTEIAFPTGGTLSYIWGVSNVTAALSAENDAVASRTMNDDVDPPAQWTYSYSGTCSCDVVVDPEGNVSQHWFGLGSPGTLTPWTGLYENQAKYYEGSSTLLKTVQTFYSFDCPPFYTGSQPCDSGVNVVPTEKLTIWLNGQQAQTTYSYDSGFSIYYPAWVNSGPLWGPTDTESGYYYGKVLTKKDYDYTGSLLRTTTTSWFALNENNLSYLNANLLDLPYSVQVTGAGPGSLTLYGYDNGAGCSAGSCGNETSVSRYLNTTGTYLTTTNAYGPNGLMSSTTDPKGNVTHYGYSNSYGGFSCPAGTGYAGSGPTAVTNAVGQTSYNCYDLTTGLVTLTQDPNLLQTHSDYDQMLRTVQIDNPDGGQALFCYTDTGSEANGGDCSQSAPPYEVRISQKITPSTNQVSYLMIDGVGREIRQAVTNGETFPYDETDTCYDGDGRVSFKSYPFQDSGPFSTARSCASPELGDSSVYDGLGRMATLTHSDGSFISTTYSGNSTTVTDEVGDTRESFTDGLGRLEEVIENPGGLNFVTTYGYDVLDDLTSVTQSGESRSFLYDSLSRLSSASNPESGTIKYTYDPDGNVVTKTDARGIITCYGALSGSSCNGTSGYDPLNRLLEKTYSDGTPTVTYSYDQSNTLSSPFTCYNMGHRTSMTDGGGTGIEAWSYCIDPGVGWQTNQQRTTNAITRLVSQQDDLLGSILSIQYPNPNGRTINYTPNAADRPTAAVDASTSVNYAANVHYWANGTACWVQYGSGVTGAETFNTRQQPLEMQATTNSVTYPGGCTGLTQTGNVLDLSYCFYASTNGSCPTSGTGNNGNVMGIANNIDTTRSQSFQYDPLNRLFTAETASTYSTSPNHCWGELYLYDNNASGYGGAWGNLTTIGVASSAYNHCAQESLSQSVINTPPSDPPNNQISGFCYDAAGNLLSESACPGSTYTYNAENQLISTAGVSYTYDGDGHRVMKSNGTIYWYGVNGEVLDESDGSGNVQNEYIYLGGKRIARIAY